MFHTWCAAGLFDGILTRPSTTASPATLRINSSAAPISTKHQPVVRNVRRRRPRARYTASANSRIPSAGSTIARPLTALAMSCAVFSSFERMITSWPLAGGSVTPSFCCATARTVAPVEPCSFDWTAATWLERPTVRGELADERVQVQAHDP